MPKISQLEYTYAMAAFCYNRGEVPSDPRARRIINSWHRSKLLRMRRQKRVENTMNAT